MERQAQKPAAAATGRQSSSIRVTTIPRGLGRVAPPATPLIVPPPPLPHEDPELAELRQRVERIAITKARPQQSYGTLDATTAAAPTQPRSVSAEKMVRDVKADIQRKVEETQSPSQCVFWVFKRSDVLPDAATRREAWHVMLEPNHFYERDVELVAYTQKIIDVKEFGVVLDAAAPAYIYYFAFYLSVLATCPYPVNVVLREETVRTRPAHWLDLVVGSAEIRLCHLFIHITVVPIIQQILTPRMRHIKTGTTANPRSSPRSPRSSPRSSVGYPSSTDESDSDDSAIDDVILTT